MKYLKQLVIILLISFAGEALNRLIPLPIPASIYGMVILFVCLEAKVFPLSAIKETSDFFLEILTVLFIPSAVALMEDWAIVQPVWLEYLTVMVVSTVIVMVVTGRVAQTILDRKKKKLGEEEEAK